jgi:hypothetical protein
MYIYKYIGYRVYLNAKPKVSNSSRYLGFKRQKEENRGLRDKETRHMSFIISGLQPLTIPQMLSITQHVNSTHPHCAVKHKKTGVDFQFWIAVRCT